MFPNSKQGKRSLPAVPLSLEPLEFRRLLTFYTVMDLGTLGGASSYAFDINSSNQVVGYAKLSTGGERAFLFKDANNNGVADAGEMVNLGTLAGYASSYAYALNNNGVIVGIAVNATNSRKAVRFQTTGTPTDLQMGIASSAYDVNIHGEIVGATLLGISYTAVHRSPTGQVTQLGTLGGGFPYSEAFAINDSGTIVGYSSTDAGDSAFVRPAGGSMTAIGFENQPFFFEYDYAWGINNDGQIAGEGFNELQQYHAFSHESGTTTDLGVPPEFTDSMGLAINSDGVIVGHGKNSAGEPRAVLFADGQALDLNGLIPSNSGWTLTKARSINDNGFIVGEGISPSGQTHAFLLSPATNVLTINGDQNTPDQDDTILLRRSASDSSLVEIFVNNNTSTPSSTFVAADYLHLIVNGGGGNDRIVPDFSAGVPFPSGGASIDGQSAGDSLEIVGTSSADNITISAGRISLGTAAINFSGIEAIQLDTDAGDDVINLNTALPFMPVIAAGAGSDSLTTGAGTYTLTSDASAASLESITLQSNTVLNLAASQHLASLSIGSTGRVNLQPDGAHFIRVNNLTVASGATLDLADNDLIIETATPDATLSMVNGLVRSARNGEARWGGVGITSSAAVSNLDTGLGAVINKNSDGTPLRTTLSGETLTTDIVLLFYTYQGDLDVSGTINADDYALIDSGYAQKLSGYHWGDIDYSGGAPNADDYFYIDRAYFNQGAPLIAESPPTLLAKFSNTAVVPEAASSQESQAKIASTPTSLSSAGRQPKHPLRPRLAKAGTSPKANRVALATWEDLRQSPQPFASRLWVALKHSWHKLFRSDILK
jgi:probable HAF family extracellular repeat protein